MREDDMNKIIIYPTNHFKKQFEMRWGLQNNFIEYLNDCLKEGYFVDDHITNSGVVFPCAGLYIPLANIPDKAVSFKAITFRWNSQYQQQPHKNLKNVNVQWVQP